MDFAKAIENAKKHIAPIMAEASRATGDHTGACVLATQQGFQSLTEQGVKVRVAGGRASFGVNKGKDGFIDYGYYPIPDSAPGNYIGHFWLVHQFGIIDFSLMYLKDNFLATNRMLGITDNRFKLDSNRVLVTKSQNVSHEKLFKGAIGYHYAEIEGRGADVWEFPTPPISPLY